MMLRNTVILAGILYTISLIVYYNNCDARSFYKTHFTRQERRQHIKQQKNAIPYVKKADTSPNPNKNFNRDKIGVDLPH